ncbi:MAG TPA: CHASE4 domain-containing protein [Candidatus Acidoferrum sp.]|nr:CHASE4 domain-containing protein [Candidatus Acidoferrum sp.]
MKLRSRMLLVLAATMVAGMAVMYFLSRELLLRNFLQLENEQMKRDVSHAAAELEDQYSSLGVTTNDYAYWDVAYEFMADPTHKDISKEFQNGQMEGLGLHLIIFRDLQGNIVFAKAYDDREHKEVAVPAAFLQLVFSHELLSPASVARTPRDGLLEFPDGPYVVSNRPILTSQRSGEPRGVLLIARRLEESSAHRATVGKLRTSVTFQSVDSASLPPDFQHALKFLKPQPDSIYVRALSEEGVAGYQMVPDILGTPLMILRVDAQRPIYERGKLSQLYVFGTVFGGAILSSFLIIFFLQKYVLSRLGELGREVNSIGKRKAIAERVHSAGSDELSSLGDSINEMLAELEKSEEQFFFLTENIHQIFWIRDAVTGQYDYISRAFEKIFGRSRDSLAGDPQSWVDLVLPEDQAVVERMLAYQAQGKSSEAHFRIRSENGDIRWLWDRAFPKLDASGSHGEIAGLTEDITDFKLNEEALMNSQLELEERVVQRTAQLAERSELVKLLVDSSSGPMYGLDEDFKCTFCNPAAVRAFGYEDAADLLGKQAHGLIHHTRADGSSYPLEECPVVRSFHEGKDAHVVDEVFWRKDGTNFPVEYSSRQIRRKGKVVGAVVSFLDITERKRQEIEVRHGQKLEAVGRLAAGIAHEINTPIQFVGDNTRFLLSSFQEELKLIRKYEQLQQAAADGTIDAVLLSEISATREQIDWPYLEKEIPRAIDQMLEGLSRVSTIVRGMKEFSHVDRSNEKAPGDINRALESTLVVARNELKYVADIETEFGELPPVLCHLGDLNQVFLNLLVNAAHAVEDVVKRTNSKGKIRVTTRKDGDFVEAAISDTGTGIPEEARDKIFDPFFTTKVVGKGTGQGLALARAIVVEKHGGTLTFVTEVGIGTTFFVRLPLLGARVPEEVLTP